MHESSDEEDFGGRNLYGYTSHMTGARVPKRSSCEVDYSGGDENDDLNSVHSVSTAARSRRRSSMGQAPTTNVTKNTSGYGSDEGESDNDERARVRKERSARRASMKASRRASAGYGSTNMNVSESPIINMTSEWQPARRASVGHIGVSTEMGASRHSSRPRGQLTGSSMHSERKSRRASMSGAPVSEGLGGASMHSERRNRRASMSGAPMTNELGPSMHSERRSRRASMSGAPIANDLGPAGSIHSERRSRRASMSGAPMPMDVDETGSQRLHRSHRRASYSGGAEELPVRPPHVLPFQNAPQQSRRGSASGAQPRAVRPSSGINPDALNRMKGHQSVPGVADEDDSQCTGNTGAENGLYGYGYGYGNGAGGGLQAGYGYDQRPVSRRPSASSQASRSSSRSRRRNSCLIRKESDPFMMMEINSGPARVPDSDLDDSDDDGSVSNPYGYSQKPSVSGGYGSDAGSQRSNRSRRRNSCLIRKESDREILAELAMGPKLVPDGDLDNSSEGEVNQYRPVQAAVTMEKRYGDATASNMNARRPSISKVASYDVIPAPPKCVTEGLNSDSEPPSDIEKYGYGSASPHISSKACEYDSDGNESRASTRSVRRNSTVIHKDMQKGPGTTVLKSTAHLVDENITTDDSSNNSTGNSYGLHYGMSLRNSYSEDESDGNEDISIASCKRSRRRNSCLECPDVDPLAESLLGSKANTADEALQDLDDPDSLLSRSGYFQNLQKNKARSYAVGAGQKNTDKLSSKDRSMLSLDDTKCSKTRIGAEQVVQNKSIARALVEPENKESSWTRSTPFTTSFTGPTEDLLGKKSSIHSRGGGLKQSLHCNWGEMDISGSDPSGSESSEESFGPSMYTDSKTFQEIDRYKQRVRRRASIEAGCIDMKEILESPEKAMQSMKIRVPTFQPAEGCTNASDFLVRCFCARLRGGITVMKHNRSRWSKSQLRVIYLLPDGKTLSWKPTEGQKDKGNRPKLDLTKCREVRHAWSADPDYRKKQGTAILRKNCKEGMAARSLALVFPKRTFDMTALSLDLCKVLMEGFSALCFRLQLHKTSDDEGDGCGLSCDHDAVEDWASTIYGPESTVSMSITNTTVTACQPWGL